MKAPALATIAALTLSLPTSNPPSSPIGIQPQRDARILMAATRISAINLLPPPPPSPLAGIETEAAAVRYCESRDNYTGKNPASTASGAYQFIDSTWTWVTGLPAPARAYPPVVQDRAFADLWDNGAGAAHWYPSRACWEPVIGPQ